MKYYCKIVCLLSTFFLFGSCGVENIFTSANYGGLKTYVEKPLYNGKKKSAVYVSGGFKKGNHQPRMDSRDDVTGGRFSIHRATTTERFKFYYGLGIDLGTYTFNTDFSNVKKVTKYNYQDKSSSFPKIDKGEKFDYKVFNLKAGFNFSKNWDKVEFNIIGFELIYLNESGGYINRLGQIPRVSNVAVIDQESLLAFNLNTEAVFKVDDDNNIGLGLFIGDTFPVGKENNIGIRGLTNFYNGVHIKYNYKRVTLSLIYEEGKYSINSTSFGLTYKFLNK